jgi:RNA polymerase subunit RPABC4/transcription elongation factor Spt4
MDDLYIGPHIFRYSSFSFLSFVLLIIWIFVIVWVYRDAERRGMNGVLWALLVFIGNLIGLLIYLIVRSDSLPSQTTAPRMQACCSCQKSVGADFAFCPHCGAQMEGVCPSCGKKVEEEWKVCPHCGDKLKDV